MPQKGFPKRRPQEHRRIGEEVQREVPLRMRPLLVQQLVLVVEQPAQPQVRQALDAVGRLQVSEHLQVGMNAAEVGGATRKPRWRLPCGGELRGR